MNVYEVYWKQTHIGTLYAEENRHKYVPDEESMKNVDVTNEPLNPVLEHFRDWGEEIPFFKTRLEANERFENLEIGFLTDFVRIVKK